MLPFLAEHLGTAIGMAGWLVGLVLGLRTFSQQGLFVVGGALADRYGVRPVVLTGCVLRIAGFAWLGYAEQTWTVIGAVLLIGFAAALFSPAVESEVARQAVIWEEEGHGPRTRVLALLTRGRTGRRLRRPAARRACCSPWTSAPPASRGPPSSSSSWPDTLRLLPQHIPGRARSRQRGGTRALLRNRRFLALCCAYGAYLLAYNQLYLALPEEVERATGSQAPLAWLFALSSLLVVCAQLPVTRWAGDRLGLRRSMVGRAAADRGRVRGRGRSRGPPAGRVWRGCCPPPGSSSCSPSARCWSSPPPAPGSPTSPRTAASASTPARCPPCPA